MNTNGKNHFSNNKLIDQLLNEVDIIKVIGQIVKLNRKGANYFGLCPFHDDKNPSMSVSQEKKIFKCFSCGAGGNVIKFVQDFYKLSFPEAVKKITELSNFNIQDYESFFKYKVSDFEILKNRYIDINNFSANIFNYQLKVKIKDQNSLTYKFLKSRKVNLSLIKEFNIGTTENLDNFIDILKKNQEYGFDDLLDIGLIKSEILPNQEINFTSVLNNRIIFPIINKNNQIIAFAGRTLVNDSVKYLNTRNSKIFTKNLHFFNENSLSLSTSINSEDSNIYLSEGYMDVLTLSRLGFKRSLGTMGLYLGNKQVELLKSQKFEKIILVPDTDNPGTLGCLRNLSTLLNSEIYNINAIILENKYKDINEFYCENYPQKDIKDLKKFLSENTFDLFRLIIFLVENTKLKNNPENEIFKIINLVKDNILKNKLIEQLADFQKISYNVLFNKFKSYIKKNSFETPTIWSSDYDGDEKVSEDFFNLELLILKQMIKYKSLRNIFLSFSCNFKNPLNKEILKYLLFESDEKINQFFESHISNLDQKTASDLFNYFKINFNLNSKEQTSKEFSILKVDFKNLILKHLILEKKDNIKRIITKFNLSKNASERKALLIKKIALQNQLDLVISLINGKK